MSREQEIHEQMLALAQVPLRELGRAAQEMAGLIETRAAEAQKNAHALLDQEVTPSELLEALIEMAYARGAAKSLEIMADMLVDATVRVGELA